MKPYLILRFFYIHTVMKLILAEVPDISRIQCFTIAFDQARNYAYVEDMNRMNPEIFELLLQRLEKRL